MKQKIISFLKIIIPIGVGVYLIWYFNNQLTSEDKVYLKNSFGEANYLWIFLSLLSGFFSVLIRAHRWKYLIDPLGYKISFWNSYHSIMLGYLVNYTIPRAGEASRAVMLNRFDRVPFNKSFGTIVAERAIDVFMLGIIGLIALFLEFKNLNPIIENFAFIFSNNQPDQSSVMKYMIYGVIIVCFVIIVMFYFFNKTFRQKAKKFVIGIFEGLLSISKSNHPWKFSFYTVLIWVVYVMMFAVCFQSLPQTQHMPFGGILVSFIAGSLGLIFIPGGIGAYPIAVGIVVTFYLYPNHNNIVHGSALGIGYIIWASQTVMMILLGLLSLILKFKFITKNDTSINS